MSDAGSPLLTVDEIATALRSGATSCVELTKSTLSAAAVHHERCGAFLDRYEDQALAAAERADRVLATDDDPGPLFGVPLVVKDLISTYEGPTTAQSLVHDTSSVTGDGFAVGRLRAAGMIVIGKTAAQEFGVGRHDPTKPFPMPRNPWNTAHATGGSSNGSASAVAMGVVPAALGTDTGGSIRIPSAFCGVTGLKPTFGRVPRSGVIPLNYSLDHLGPIARSARDCELLLTTMAGFDPSDASSVDRQVPGMNPLRTTDLTGLRIGVSRHPLRHSQVAPDLPMAFDRALTTFAELGAETREIELPLEEQMRAVYAVTASSEALAYHAPDLEDRWNDYFASTRSALVAGVLYSAADYIQAQRVRRVAQTAVTQLFKDVDVIVTPTTSFAAPSIANLEHYYLPEGQRAVHTQYWNLLGNPALSVPIGQTREALPLGLQIIGRPFEEATVLGVGDAFQYATDWHRLVPPSTSPGDPAAGARVDPPVDQ